MLASLIEPANCAGVDPEAYLSDVLTRRVNNWPNSRLAELTPWAWAAQHRSSSIREVNRTVNPPRRRPKRSAYNKSE